MSLASGAVRSFPLRYDGADGGTLLVRAGPVDVVLSGVLGPPHVCRIARG